MISRIWHGWTDYENADNYQSLLETEILPGIANRRISGYKGAHLLRRDLENEVEFITILWFETMEAVREFAGEDYDVSVVPPRARALLSRFDDRSQHYQTLIEPQER
ncbi:MAG: antibiotic biosynthesis monooxygenase [Acidobacteria bacterium]|nr:MAG: antibiotic biosynthesis monooxygenase [Acidobacteriota bacterium]